MVTLMPYAITTRPVPPQFNKISIQCKRDKRRGRGGGKRLTGSWLGRVPPQREMRSRLVIASRSSRERKTEITQPRRRRKGNHQRILANSWSYRYIPKSCFCKHAGF